MVIECYLPDGEEVEFDILDAGFFDDETVVIVYRLCDTNGKYKKNILLCNLQTKATPDQTCLATVKYDAEHIVGYQKLSYEKYVKVSDREGLMHAALDLWKTGQVRGQ